MKATRIICPRCKAETVSKTNLKNTSYYTEEILYKKCQRCAKLEPTPEERLLEALFGGSKSYKER